MKILLSIAAMLLAICGMASELPNGDAQIRARAGGSEIIVTTAARFAGAIQSLTWDGVEFINSADHGRELQSACSFDNTSMANAETFNPTEAGSRSDGAGPVATRLLATSVRTGTPGCQGPCHRSKRRGACDAFPRRTPKARPQVAFPKPVPKARSQGLPPRPALKVLKARPKGPS